MLGSGARRTAKQQMVISHSITFTFVLSHFLASLGNPLKSCLHRSFSNIVDFALLKYYSASVNQAKLPAVGLGMEHYQGSAVNPDNMGAGASADVSFEDGSDNCLYDLRAIAEDGRELDARQINFCEISDYTIDE